MTLLIDDFVPLDVCSVTTISVVAIGIFVKNPQYVFSSASKGWAEIR
ncbi:MAG: hypothetical protein ACI9FG_000225 [Crocinitomicaceae bacterium]|jgi:hypothetical protein